MGKVFSKKLKRLINLHSVISFDIFDTLIKRNCYEPTDIFKLVEKKYNEKQEVNKINDFKNIRIIAERKARYKNKNVEDITLDEIYDEIDLNKSSKEILKELEIEIELDLCQKNNDFNEILKYCKDNEKKIICISDMYLNIDVIKKILNCYEIEFEKIYISSEIRKTKITGNLFKYVLNDMKIEKNSILHIGDSWKADFLSPLKIGIKAFHIKKHNFNYEFIKSKKINYADVSCNIIYSFINNNEKKINNYYSKLGYEIIGPLCLDFCFWLNENAKKDKIENLLFCARDMQMIQEIFNIYFGNEIKSNYFYVSRKSIYLPYLYKKRDFDFFAKLIPLTKRKMTIKELFEMFNINFNDMNIEHEILKYNLKFDEKYSYKDLITSSDFKRFYNEIMINIIDLQGKKQFNNFLSYINLLDYDKNTAIIDLGWRGTTQNLMIDITEKNILGYYFGLNSLNGNNLKDNFRTYLFCENNNNYSKEVYSFMALIELLVSALHGSTLSYSDNKESPYLLGKCSNSNNQFIIDIQNGAMMFCNDFVYLKKYIKHGDEKLMAENFISIGINPTYKMAKNLGNIYTENIKTRNLCDCKSLFFYFLHPQKLKEDFVDSEWKVGFMKCLFKIKLPYFKLYNILKNKFK